MPLKMIPIKFSTLLVLLFVLSGCNETSTQPGNLNKMDTNKNAAITSTISVKPTDSVEKNNEKEEKIIDAIFKLKEVRARARYIEQQTKGERHLKVWVEDTPHLPDQKYYWIKAAKIMGRI